MTINFKEGDLVVCQPGTSYRLPTDKPFTVTVSGDGYLELDRAGIPGSAYKGPYNPDRFSLWVPAPVTDQHAAETVEGKTDVEDDGFVTHQPEWAQAVESEAAEDSLAYRIAAMSPAELERETAVLGEMNRLRDMWPHLTESGLRSIAETMVKATKAPAEAMQELNEAETNDIKATIADEAKRIVSGARRSAYGKPEANFERISRYWTAYMANVGKPIEITAADVSPMMILMKLARLAESPQHLDSMIDAVGYTLTMAEVNGVKPSA
jgi:hypothetical protein